MLMKIVSNFWHQNLMYLEEYFEEDIVFAENNEELIRHAKDTKVLLYKQKGNRETVLFEKLLYLNPKLRIHYIASLTAELVRTYSHFVDDFIDETNTSVFDLIFSIENPVEQFDFIELEIRLIDEDSFKKELVSKGADNLNEGGSPNE